MLQADLVSRVDLPAGVQQALDFGLHLGHASADGFLIAVLVERVRRLEAQPAEPQEQLVRGGLFKIILEGFECGDCCDGLWEGVEGSAVAGVECPPGLQSGCCSFDRGP